MKRRLHLFSLFLLLIVLIAWRLPDFSSPMPPLAPWLPLGYGLDDPGPDTLGGTGAFLDDNVMAIACSATDVFAGGLFQNAKNKLNQKQIFADHVAKFNDTDGWRALVSGVNAIVYALEVDGSGNLYVGGEFGNASCGDMVICTTSCTGSKAPFLAKWDVSANSGAGGWCDITPTVLNGKIHAIKLIGTDLYIGGGFTNAGGIDEADYIAKIDLTSPTYAISALGGAAGVGALNDTLFALESNGTNILYVGGEFVNAAGNVDSDFIALWNTGTSSWGNLSKGMDGLVRSLAYDAAGGLLYAGGNFNEAGGVAETAKVACYNTTLSGWTPLKEGLSSLVRAVEVDANGYVYAGGDFTNAGGSGANMFARWTPGPGPGYGTWEQIADNLDPGERVLAIKADNSGNIIVGGEFLNLGGCDRCDHIAKIELSTLPVELVELKAENHESDIMVSWKTATQKNNDYFQVEHSLDGKQFTAIARVKGAGTSNQQKIYQHLHQNPGEGTHYYRLKQVDLGGSFEFSKLVSAKILADNAIQLFPNPTDGIFNIQFKNISGKAIVKVSDALGRTILQQTLSSDDQIDISNQPAGWYVVEIRQGENTLVQRVKKD